MDLIDQQLVQRFIGETGDGIDRVERLLVDAGDGAPSLEHIHATFRALHSIKGNAGFFGFGNVEEVVAAAETALDRVRARSAPWTADLADALLATVDRVRSHLAALAELDQGTYSAEGFTIAPDDADRELITRLSGPVSGPGSGTGPASAPPEDSPAPDTPESDAPELSVGAEFARRDVRVETSRLDDLISLVGELVTAQSMVLDNPLFASTADRQLTRAATRLRKVSRELQESAMGLRLVPLTGLFGRMRRLVHDVAQQTGKPVDLVTDGGETEMDKNVVEKIADPLVHIIRNAVDHGIESAADRLAAGKPESGMVQLSASHMGSEVVITVQDDGAGLDRDAIRERAVQRGLIAEQDTLTDREIFGLIFEPGFSTAAAISDLSGRGVGMDVVRRNIEELRGRVEVASAEGTGTTVTLRIPLTLAILEGVTGRIGEVHVSFPLDEIQEFYRPRREDVVNTDAGREALLLRGTPIPFIRLADLYEVDGAETDPAKSTVVVAHSNQQVFGAMIDAVDLSHQFMVRPLPDYLLGLRAVSGCTVLGTGAVSMIIDSRALAQEELARMEEVHS